MERALLHQITPDWARFPGFTARITDVDAGVM
jgi:hypothetical protein